MQVVCSLVSILPIALNLAYNKNKFDVLNFDFVEKDLEIVLPPHIVYNLLTDQVSLPDCLLLLVMLVNICIALIVNLSNQVVFLHDEKVKTKL